MHVGPVGLVHRLELRSLERRQGHPVLVVRHQVGTPRPVLQFREVVALPVVARVGWIGVVLGIDVNLELQVRSSVHRYIDRIL